MDNNNPNEEIQKIINNEEPNSESGDSGSKSSKTIIIVAVITAIVALIIGVIATYFWQQNATNSEKEAALASQSDNYTSQIKELEKQLKAKDTEITELNDSNAELSDKVSIGSEGIQGSELPLLYFDDEVSSDSADITTKIIEPMTEYYNESNDILVYVECKPSSVSGEDLSVTAIVKSEDSSTPSKVIENFSKIDGEYSEWESDSTVSATSSQDSDDTESESDVSSDSLTDLENAIELQDGISEVDGSHDQSQ